MIIKIKPDIQKAKSLLLMAKITLERLESTEMEKNPTNTLNDYYDIIHKLMEALTLLNGVKIKGEGAHQELIDFISRKYSFEEKTRLLLQQMRDYRNRIYYEGFSIDKNYLILNKVDLEKIIFKLQGFVK